ncbi:cation:proton antiporter [Vallitalea sediminicola]|uniref:pH regulation protein F n=1 Tax=Vallitalea guaymasensis TaxID=1185412 RepID=A0A8J8M748_9FIRM|nr:pH regulation protein F [Vallitalea guaymasensis]
MIYYLFSFLLVLSILSIVIIIKGPTIWDRLLGLNLFSAKIILLILLFSILFDLPYLLDIAIVYTLLGFIGIIFISRFVKGKGKI